MRRFRSKYDALLRLREQSARMAEQQQLAAKHKMDAAREELQALERRLQDRSETLAKDVGNPTPAGRYHVERDLLRGLQGRIFEARQRVGEIEPAFRDAAAKRAKLATEVEALNTLRSSQWNEHRKAARQATQKELDDHAMNRWNAAGSTKEERSHG